MKKAIRTIVLVVLCVTLVVPSVFAGSDGQKLQDSIGTVSGENVVFIDEMEVPYFQTVLEEYQNKGYDFEPSAISLSPSKATGHKGIEIIEGKEAYRLTREVGEVSYRVTVEKDAAYEIVLDYFMLSDTGVSGKHTVLIDGETQFFEADSIAFHRLWQDENEPIVNGVGDEVKPRQEELHRWQTYALEDTHGFYSLPLNFFLSAGEHTITLRFVSEDIAIGNMTLRAPTKLEPYSKPSETGVGESIYFEAEKNAVEKNDSTLRRESDADPATIPSDPRYIKLNMMGGVTWNKANQKITWRFSVEKAGLYSVNLKCQQMWLNGIPSFRKIEIDNKVPCEELLNYRFGYDRSWRAETLKTPNGETMLFYLDKGEHTLSMSVKMGPLTKILQEFNEDSLKMSAVMLDIMRLTGTTPDPNYDYEFFKNIPDLEKRMRYLSDRLQKKYDALVELCNGDVPGLANSIKATKKQLDELIEEPFLIAKNMNVLTNLQASIGSWYSEYQTQPLSIDYFTFNPPDAEFKVEKSGFWQKMEYLFISLITSFVKDYDSVSGFATVNATESINVWIARGTEWATLIKELADAEWTPKSNVAVNMNILPASQLNAGAVNALMLSIVSGKAPDVAMGVDPSSPVEFAIRDAVQDLSGMEDFDQVKERFVSECLVPFQYKGGVFALPETMDFRVMIYRKDIVSSLGINLPETRADLYSHVLPVLKQNGMNFYYPRDDTQFIFQNGGQFYTDDGRYSALDSAEAYNGLKEETELYTSYGIPISASFYNRFRTGEMPIGIGNFAEYMNIMVAAPELAGRVGLAPIPGVKKEDGTIDRSVGNITGQTVIMLKTCKDQDVAWSFMDWWTSTETQTDFGREIEAQLGLSARWNSANNAAFEAMSWNAEDLDVLREMRQHYREVPVVLGGYFTGRYLTNAWNSVVISGMNLRDSLEDAVFEINRELKMKQEEYGFLDEE